METFLIKALQLILSLSIIVVVHEFGHFIVARLFKVRVEKFYLFFDPWFSLFKFKPKNSDTEYGIGWLPLGGYCKISGMIDESIDKEQMKQPPKPYEFRSKSAGKRLLIMIAGVVFNFLLAIFIYSMVLFNWGDTYLPLKNATDGMYYSETFKKIGFEDGDVLLKADGEPLERLNEHYFRKIVNSEIITVLRHDEEVTITMPNDMVQRMMKDKQGFATYRYPLIIGKVISEQAKSAGIKAGDQIVAVNDVPTKMDLDVGEQLRANKGQTIPIQVLRDQSLMTLSVTLDTAGMIGVNVKSYMQIYTTVTKQYGFFSSFPAGIKLGVNVLKGYVNDMKYVFTKEGASNLGGFGAIGNLFPPVWNWHTFWMMTAFLSVIIAFMNILPIPALDGGHVLFLIYEVVTRRKPSDKFLEYAQIAGMLLLFALLLYANGNDLYRFFFK